MPFLGTFTHNRRTKAEHKPSGSLYVGGGTSPVPIARGIRSVSVYAVGAGGGGGASNVQYTYISSPGSYDPAYMNGTSKGGSGGGGGGAAAANNVRIKYGDTVTAVGGTGGAGGPASVYSFTPTGTTLVTTNPGQGSTGGNSYIQVGSTAAVSAGGGTGGRRSGGIFTYSTTPSPVPARSNFPTSSLPAGTVGTGGSGSFPTPFAGYSYLENKADQTGGSGGRTFAYSFLGAGGGGAAGFAGNGAPGTEYQGPTNINHTAVAAELYPRYSSSSIVRAPSSYNLITSAGGGGIQSTGGGINKSSLYGTPVTTAVPTLTGTHDTSYRTFPSPYSHTYGDAAGTSGGDYRAPPSSYPADPIEVGGGGAGTRGRASLSDGGTGADGGIVVKWGYDADYRYDNIKQPATFSQGGYNNIQYESDGSLSTFSASVTAPSVPINEGSTKTYSISTVNPPSPSATFYYRMFLEDSDGNENMAPSNDVTPTNGSITLSLGEATKTITVVEDETTEPLHDFMKMKISTTSINGPYVAESPVARINDTSQTPPPLNPGYIEISTTGVTAAKADGNTFSLMPTISSGSNFVDIPSDDGINYINVLAIGGGGGGSAGRAYPSYPSYSFTAYGGTGGGGGQTRIVERIPVTPGQRIYFGVGAGGSAGPGPASPVSGRLGGDGSPSWVNFSSASGTSGSRIVAAGGGGGPFGPSPTTSPIHGGGNGYTPGSGVFSGVTNSWSKYRNGGNGGALSQRTNPTYTPGQIRYLYNCEGSGGGGAGLSRSYSNVPYNPYSGYGAQSWSSYQAPGRAGYHGGGGGGGMNGSGGGMSTVYSRYIHPGSPTVMGPFGYQPANGGSGTTAPGNRGKLGNYPTGTVGSSSYGGGGASGKGVVGSSYAPPGYSGTAGRILITWGDESYLDASSPRAPSTVRNNSSAPNYP